MKYNQGKNYLNSYIKIECSLRIQWKCNITSRYSIEMVPFSKFRWLSFKRVLVFIIWCKTSITSLRYSPFCLSGRQLWGVYFTECIADRAKRNSAFINISMISFSDFSVKCLGSGICYIVQWTDYMIFRTFFTTCRLQSAKKGPVRFTELSFFSTLAQQTWDAS